MQKPQWLRDRQARERIRQRAGYDVMLATSVGIVWYVFGPIVALFAAGAAVAFWLINI